MNSLTLSPNFIVITIARSNPQWDNKSPQFFPSEFNFHRLWNQFPILKFNESKLFQFRSGENSPTTRGLSNRTNDAVRCCRYFQACLPERVPRRCDRLVKHTNHDRPIPLSGLGSTYFGHVRAPIGRCLRGSLKMEKFAAELKGFFLDFVNQILNFSPGQGSV